MASWDERLGGGDPGDVDLRYAHSTAANGTPPGRRRPGTGRPRIAGILATFAEPDPDYSPASCPARGATLSWTSAVGSSERVVESSLRLSTGILSPSRRIK